MNKFKCYNKSSCYDCPYAEHFGTQTYIDKNKKLVIDSMFRCTYLKLNKIQINFKIDEDK